MGNQTVQGVLLAMVFSFGVKWFLTSLKNFYKNLGLQNKNKIYLQAVTYSKMLRKWIPSQENEEKIILNKQGG